MYLNTNRITTRDNEAFQFLGELSKLDEDELSQLIITFIEEKMDYVFEQTDVEGYLSMEPVTINQIIDEQQWNHAAIITEMFGWHDYKKLLLLKQVELEYREEESEDADEMLTDDFIYNDAKTRLS